MSTDEFQAYKAWMKDKVKNRIKVEQIGDHESTNCSWMQRVKIFLEKDYDSLRELYEAFRDYGLPQVHCQCKRHVVSWPKYIRERLRGSMRGFNQIPSQYYQIKPEITGRSFDVFEDMFKRQVFQHSVYMQLADHKPGSCEYLRKLNCVLK